MHGGYYNRAPVSITTRMPAVPQHATASAASGRGGSCRPTTPMNVSACSSACVTGGPLAGSGRYASAIHRSAASEPQRSTVASTATRSSVDIGTVLEPAGGGGGLRSLQGRTSMGSFMPVVCHSVNCALEKRMWCWAMP